MLDSELQPSFSTRDFSIKHLQGLSNLQKNDNEALYEHINQLGRICTWIGKNLNGFDPSNPEDISAINSIAALSNTVAMLEHFAKH